VQNFHIFNFSVLEFKQKTPVALSISDLGVPLRVGLFAAMACLYGQTIYAAIPNARTEKSLSKFFAIFVKAYKSL
jgi:hypothetical protein